MLALLPRLHGALTLGWHWDGRGSFNLVNFDEGGSCRAALRGFEYSPFVGHQTIALSGLFGNPPPPGAGDAASARGYCHGARHIVVARAWSAILGALTVPVLVLIGWQLRPATPGLGLAAGGLLALSGFHISQSFFATVDAASTFFIHLFLLAVLLAVLQRRRLALAASAPLLAAAVWTKYWIFAPLAWLALLPESFGRALGQGFSRRHLAVALLGAVLLPALVTNSEFPRPGGYLALPLFYLLVPWRGLHRWLWLPWALVPPVAVLLAQWDLFAAFTTGADSGRFGTSYGAIGWHKWLRNAVNLPLLLLVALGLPGFLALLAGARALWRAPVPARGWLCLLPVGVFALFMLFLSPVTYYRHYLPLVPTAALLAALGLWQLRPAPRALALALCLAWAAALATDLVLDYHRDPRIALRAWYAAERPERVFSSFYVNPPPVAQHWLFHPRHATGSPPALARADYLVLSENWYDTAFANELNGPLVGDLTRLVKTTPARARFYRKALAGRHPLLAVERVFPVPDIMPELVLHKAFYGTFQLFIGDIVVLRVRDPGNL